MVETSYFILPNMQVIHNYSMENWRFCQTNENKMLNNNPAATKIGVQRLLFSMFCRGNGRVFCRFWTVEEKIFVGNFCNSRTYIWPNRLAIYKNTKCTAFWGTRIFKIKYTLSDHWRSVGYVFAFLDLSWAHFECFANYNLLNSINVLTYV